MAKVVKSIVRFNADRDPERLAMKYLKMRASPFVFLRATCHLYYAQLPDAAALRKAPAAWVCGDLHLENFGSYKGDNRLVHFDINDFDEGVLAPASWDLVRFLSSVMVGRKSLGVGAREARELCKLFVEAYAGALVDGKARWIERETASGPVRELLESLRTRKRADLLAKRTVVKGRRRALRVDGIKALAASESQHDAVRRLIAAFAKSQPDPAFYEVLDVARRVAGKGSLGLDRFAILVRGRGEPDGHYLLDLKQAPASALAGVTPLAQPPWADDSARVVSIQRRMQAISAAFLHSLQMAGRPYILRDLQPSDDRVELSVDRPQAGRTESLLSSMANCLAWAQLRSAGRNGSACADELIDYGSKGKWRAPLIETACVAATQAEADWTQFAQAYDDGVFSR